MSALGSSFSTFGFRTNNTVVQMYIDEIMIGTTWADVVPGVVPEPASLALLGLGGLALLKRQRKP